MKLLVLFLALLAVSISAKAQKSYATIDHVALYVQNLDSSAGFYSRLFRLESLPNPFPKARVKWLKLGNHIQLHLIEGAKAAATLPFMDHLCLSVASLDEFMMELDKRSIPYYSGADLTRGINHRPDGVNQVFIKDPDNYWVEINNATH